MGGRRRAGPGLPFKRWGIRPTIFFFAEADCEFALTANRQFFGGGCRFWARMPGVGAADLKPAAAAPPPAEPGPPPLQERIHKQLPSKRGGVIIHINPNIPNIPTVNPISIPISHVIIICSARRSGLQVCSASRSGAEQFVVQGGAAFGRASGHRAKVQAACSERRSCPGLQRGKRKGC